MAFSSLRDFIDRLERDGRLVRVGEPVSPTLEMTEIQTRLLAEGGPAVLFENVVNCEVLTPSTRSCLLVADPCRHTALIAAVSTGRVDVAAMLLDRGADPTRRSHSGLD